MSILNWIYWDPAREAFTIPYFNHPIAWYGICFVAGLMIGYGILACLFQNLFSQSLLYVRDFANFGEFKKQLPLSPFASDIPFLNDPEKVVTYFNNKNISRDSLKKYFPKAIYSSKELGLQLTDKMLWFILLGILIGARLGHVLFYDWTYYSAHPEKIIKIWEGGLASHGGTIGVMLSLYLYYRLVLPSYPEITLAKLFDMVVIPTALVAFFIRLGNFFNQEITGTSSTLPWAIVFGHPAEGRPNTPRHPVQLYEAFVYLGIFFLLWAIWKRKAYLKPFFITGLFFFLVFTSRFLIEFLKMPQNGIFDQQGFLQTGQLLSIPFIILGIILMIPCNCRNYLNKKTEA